MGKKLASGIFAGLLGAGLYAAYQKLDEDKKNRMKKNLREKSDELRDRAVDYAFYANDAMSDFKDVLKDEMDQAKGNVKDASSKFSEKAKTFTDNQQETEDGNAEKSKMTLLLMRPKLLKIQESQVPMMI
ncbi:hypothetical protein [Lentilactobacillus rapi]|uniref:hypothetical protein n=1 Tax=Lentilactobacillus rapi TaxID=481723 RepID=UPI000B1D8EEF